MNTSSTTARDELNAITFAAVEDKDRVYHKAARLGLATAAGGIGGRMMAWHPVTGGKMNRATMIGAGVGALSSGVAEAIASHRQQKTRGDVEKRAGIRGAGVAVPAAGLLGGYMVAGMKANDEAMQESADRMSHSIGSIFGGSAREDVAARMNARHLRRQGMDGGETFIPKMPKWGKKAVSAATGRPMTVDETGGDLEEKLQRLASRAKGTPEGAAAAAKLNRLRTKGGKTFVGKIKKAFGGAADSARSFMERFKSQPARKVIGALHLSARDTLDDILFAARKKEDHTIRNVGVGTAAVAGLGGTGYLAYKGGKAIDSMASSVNRNARRMVAGSRGIVRNQIIPEAHDIVQDKIMPAFKEMKNAAENVKYATSYTSDIGRLYSHTAKPGFHNLVHPIQTLKEAKRQFRRGVVEAARGKAPEASRFVKAGKAARKFVKGFSCADTLDMIKFWVNPLMYADDVALLAQRMQGKKKITKNGQTIDSTSSSASLSARDQLATILFGARMNKAWSAGLNALGHEDLRKVGKYREAIRDYTGLTHMREAAENMGTLSASAARKRALAIGVPAGLLVGGAIGAKIASDSDKARLRKNLQDPKVQARLKWHNSALAHDRSTHPEYGDTSGFHAHQASRTLLSGKRDQAKWLTPTAVFRAGPGAIKGREEALKKIKESREKSLSARGELDTILFGGDPRPRNTLGEFSGNAQGGPNPQSMALTYQPQVVQQGMQSASMAGQPADQQGQQPMPPAPPQQPLRKIVKRQ